MRAQLSGTAPKLTSRAITVFQSDDVQVAAATS
jgi:hypothetical protein